MLREYFSLGITIEGMVDCLPVLIPDYAPNLDKLPLFFMRLGPQVSRSRPPPPLKRGRYSAQRIKVTWNNEQECFDTVLRELAYFYVPGPVEPGCGKDDDADRDHQAANASQGEVSEKWQIEHVLFPAMKRYMTAPKSLLTRDVVQIASLPDLYRVFERC